MAKRRKARSSVTPTAAAVVGAALGDGQQQAEPTALSPGTSRLAQQERFLYWRPMATDADSEQEWDLADMRGFSADLVRTAPVATGAIQTRASHIVGTGLSLQSRINAQELGLSEDEATAWQRKTQDRFAMWAESEYSTVEGEYNFYEAQDIIMRSHDTRGDIFVLLTSKERTGKGWPFRLALQLIEADRVCNENNKANTDTLVDGVERSSDGEPRRIWVSKYHPNRLIASGANKWEPIDFRTGDRRNVLHVKRMHRPGQTRGYPMLAPIIATLKQVTRYSDAEVDAAVNSAAQAIFATMDADGFDNIYAPEEQQAYLERAKQSTLNGYQSGQVVNLLPGESVVSPTPGRPNPNYEPFFSAMLNLISIGLNMPKEVLTKAFNSSYSASRAALMDAYRTWKIERAWLVRRFLQPGYEEWLADAVALGIIQAPGFFSDPFIRRAWCGSNWCGDGPGALDPHKEAQAAALRMDIGLTSLDEEKVAYDGGSWQATHGQRVTETKERVEGGLQPALVAAAPAAPAAAPPEEKPSQEEADSLDEDSEEEDS